MSNFLVPNSFVPGTKAKAQDVNENFSAVQDELNLKAEQTGNINQTFLVAPATDDNHAITKNQVETLVDERSDEICKNFISPFSVESGYVNSSGKPAYMSYSSNTLSFNVDDGTTYAPLVVNPANNQSQFVLESIPSINISSYANGTYNVFVKSDETVYLLNNTIFSQYTIPSSPALNSIFENTSVWPVTVKIYNGTQWEDFNDVFIGSVVISSGAITKIIYAPFTNRWSSKPFSSTSRVNSVRPAVIIDSYRNNNSWYRIYSDGWCEQGGITEAVTLSAQNGTSGAISLLKTYDPSGPTPNVNITAYSLGDGRCAGGEHYTHSYTQVSWMLQNFNKSASLSCRCWWEAKGYLAVGTY